MALNIAVRLAPILLLSVASCASCTRSAESFGSCEDIAQTEWLPDGRSMKLLRDFTYVAPDATRWEATAGSVIDGASIPRVVWSLIGGPFEGKYREPSIVHDVACEKQDHDWRDVHRMFYDACLCEGVNDLQAKIMYAAVRAFGPRWGEDREPETILSSEEDFDRLQLVIATEPDLKIEEVEQLTGPALRARAPALAPRPDPRSLALPRLRDALPPGGGQLIPAEEQGTIALHPGGGEPGRPERIDRLRKSAVAEIDAQRERLERQIAGEKNREKRAVLASRLLELNRARAAVGQVNLKVATTPPP